jgi:hypothetical protein
VSLLFGSTLKNISIIYSYSILVYAIFIDSNDFSTKIHIYLTYLKTIINQKRDGKPTATTIFEPIPSGEQD